MEIPMKIWAPVASKVGSHHQWTEDFGRTTGQGKVRVWILVQLYALGPNPRVGERSAPIFLCDNANGQVARKIQQYST